MAKFKCISANKQIGSTEMVLKPITEKGQEVNDKYQPTVDVIMIVGKDHDLHGQIEAGKEYDITIAPAQ